MVSCTVTTLDGLYKLTNLEPIEFCETSSTECLLEITPDKTYQPFLGVGFSVDETSVCNYYGMSKENRLKILHEFFDKDKQNCSVIRICLGTSDMTGRPYYSYDDMPDGQTDVELKHFSIQKDIDYHIIDLIKEIVQINPDVKIFASVWSPPAWMKTNRSLLGEFNGIGGELIDKYVGVYAHYLHKAICAYREQGVEIFGLNPINEPNWNNNIYPQCVITPEQEGRIIKLLAKLFEADKINTKLLIMDTDFIHTDRWAMSELSDTQINPHVWGVAFHPYMGDVSEMSHLHDAYPDKAIIFTERSWEEPDKIGGICEAIELFRNHARTYIDWVNFSDSERGPIMGPYHCTGWVTAERGKLDNWHFPIDKYLYEHFSRFIQRDAIRIDSNDCVCNVVFKNPDGSYVLTVANHTDIEQSFTVSLSGRQFNAYLPAKSIASYCW